MNRRIFAFIFICLFVINLKAIVVIDNPPSEAITINVSNHSVNRLVLPSQILDVSFSKEKGVDIKVVDNQAFIKYQPIIKEKIHRTSRNKEEVIGQPETVYDKAQSSEVFFITEAKTYSIILNPIEMEAETIIINDFSASKEEVVKYESEDPFIATMSKITKSIFTNGVPQGYKTKKINKIIENTSTLETKEINNYDGVLYSVSLLEVRNKTDKALVLNPKEYIKFAKQTPKAISVYYANEVNHLLPYSKASVIIITKGVR